MGFFRSIGGKILNQYKQYDPEILDRLHKVELSVLKEFVRVCEKYDIQYFALFGTNIGAARHNGFIPWDDDIDLGMLRSDYEKLLEVVPKECKGEYRVVGPDCNEKFYNLVPHFCKSGTRFATNYDHGNYNMGIGFDIFVYDPLSDDEKIRKKQVSKTSFYRALYMAYNVNFYKYSVFKEGNLLPRIAAGCMHYLLHLFPSAPDCFYKRHQKYACCVNGDSRYVTQFGDSMQLQCAIAYDELFPLTKLKFEDIELCVPGKYDTVLRRVYGDYMQLPPIEKRQNHYPYLLDLGDGMIIKGEE